MVGDEREVKQEGFEAKWREVKRKNKGRTECYGMNERRVKGEGETRRIDPRERRDGRS